MLSALGAIGGSVISGLFGNKAAKQNIKYQKQFAQQGIQWKVKDAKAAGIHPLAALGAQTHSFAPVAAGDFSGLAGAGQDLGRAISATQNGRQRVDGYTKTVQKLSLQRMGLENELLASQIARVRQPATPPASPPTNPNALLLPGQGDSPGIKNEAFERAGWNPEKPWSEAGAVTDLGFTRTETGWAPTMSKEAKDRLEDDMAGIIGWNLRNRLPQTFQQNLRPPFDPLSDEYWVYHPGMQEYRLRRRKRSGTHSRFRFRETF